MTKFNLYLALLIATLFSLIGEDAHAGLKAVTTSAIAQHAPATIITCNSTDQSARVQALLAVSGSYRFVAPAGKVCNFGNIVETGVTLDITADVGTIIQPQQSLGLSPIFKFTTSVVTIHDLTIDGNGLAQIGIWASTGTDLYSYRNNLSNFGFPVATATEAVQAYRIDGADEWVIEDGSVHDLHSVGDGPCGGAIGEVRAVRFSNAGFGVIRNLTVYGGDGLEDNDYIHSETGNVGGLIVNVKARYNTNTRRILKLQSGDWTVVNSDFREGTDFVPVAGQQIGVSTLNMVDKAGNFSGNITILGGYYDCRGYATCISNTISTIGTVRVEGGAVLVGATSRQTRPAFGGAGCISALTNYDTPGVSWFTGDTDGSVRGALFFGFGRPVVAQGAYESITNNFFDDPYSFIAEIGSGTAKDGNNFSGNGTVTRTSGNLNLTRMVRVFNDTNVKVDDNYLLEAGNTTHAAKFIDFTDATATGEANHNLTQNLTTATVPVTIPAAASVAITNSNNIPGGATASIGTTSLTASTTLTAINSLSAPVLAGKTYHFKVQAFFTADATGGHQYSLNGGTATMTSIQWHITSVCDATKLIVISVSGTTLAGTGSDSASGCLAGETTIEGTFVVNAIGTFVPQFAQAVASGTSLTKVNSSMNVYQIK